MGRSTASKSTRTDSQWTDTGDENGLTVDGYRRLEPESKKSMYLGNLIGIIIAAVIIFAALHFSESWFPDNHDLVNIALYAILAILVVYGHRRARDHVQALQVQDG